MRPLFEHAEEFLRNLAGIHAFRLAGSGHDGIPRAIERHPLKDMVLLIPVEEVCG